MTQPALYDVLRPIYWRTPVKTPEGEYLHRVQWMWVGTAHDLDDAKRRFGGSPVLRPATN
jgi:hypothetical protein